MNLVVSDPNNRANQTACRLTENPFPASYRSRSTTGGLAPETSAAGLHAAPTNNVDDLSQCHISSGIQDGLINMELTFASRKAASITKLWQNSNSSADGA
jgi:hypothetical protein